MELSLTEILIAIACPVLGLAALIGLMHYLAKFHNESHGEGSRRGVQFTLRTLLLVVLIIAVVVCVDRDRLRRWIDGGFGLTPAYITTITSVQDLNKALATERCILLLDVDWDVYSVATRRAVEDFLRHRHQYEGVPKVPVCSVDITDFRGPVFEALSRWSATAVPDAKRSIYYGTGPLLWMQGGVVKDCLSDGLDTQTLVEKTRQAFRSR